MRTLIASSAVVAMTLTVAAPAAFAQAQQEQTPQNRFCQRINNEDQMRCAYRTLAQCERAGVPRGATSRCYDRTYMIAATPPPGETTTPAERSPSPRGGRRGRSSH